MAEVAADTSGPWFNLKLGDADYSRLFQTMNNGVVEGLSVTVNGAATALVVNTGFAVKKGRMARFTSSKTVAPATPPASGSRIDRMVIRYNTTTATAKAITLSGSTNAGPSILAGDTEFDLPLARFLVKASAPQVSQIVDERLPDPKGVIPKSDITALNVQDVSLGQVAVSPTVGWIRYFDGALFRAPMLHARTGYTPAWTMQNAAGTKRGSYLRIDQNLAWVEGSITATTGASLGTGQISASLPFPCAANIGAGAGRYVGDAWWSRGTGGVLKRLIAVVSPGQSTVGIYMADGNQNYVQPGDVGLSWIPGDVLTFTISYPVASES